MNENEQTTSLFECFRPRRKLESESEGSVEKTVKNVTKLSQGRPGLKDTQVMNTNSTPYMILRRNGSRRGAMAGYAGLVKPIEQAEKLGGVAAIVRA